jgi:phytoene dehydrogenase-like protein
MQKAVPKESYDVTVIGAGVGGLTAASILSKAGFSVCVLEKEPHAGGYLAGFRRKHFRFDTAIHWLNQCGAGGLVNRLFDFLGTDHPVAVPQQRIRRYKGDSFDYLLTNNPDEWRDQLIREFPEDKKGIEKFFKAAKKIGKSMMDFNVVFRSEETMNFSERLKNKLRLINFVIPFIPYITYSGEKGLAKGLRKFFKNEALHKIFVSEMELLGCLVPIGWAYYGDFQSPPKGGGQVIPEWLQHTIEQQGSDLFFKATVNEILLEGNTCKGVRFTQRGTAYEVKSKYVIAACDVETLYEKMLPAHSIPEKLKQKLRVADLYSSSVTISIALDCPTESLGFNEELLHLASEGVSFEDHHGGDPAKTEISILAPSQRDKSMAPKGNGTLTLFMPAFMHAYNEWGTGKDENGNYLRNEAYEKIKTEIAEIIIARVEEKIAPGLRQHILFYDVATPVTHWRYTGNKNGTMMGAKPGRQNMQNKIAHYQTPVQNLLLGGHWAELGGGVPIAVKAGSNAALLILRKEKKPAFQSLADYMDHKISLEAINRTGSFKLYDNSWVQELTPAQKQENFSALK